MGLVAASLLGACSSGDREPITSVPPPAPAVVVSMTPTNLTLTAGTSGAFAVSVTGGPPAAVLQQCTSSNTTVATTAVNSAECRVSALSPGIAQITAVASSGQTAASSLSVLSPAPSTVTITSPGDVVPLGLSAQLSAVVRDPSGAVVTGDAVQWSSSDSTVARVDAAGLVSSQRVGTVVISAVARGVRASSTLAVNSAPPITSCRLPNRTGTVGFGLPRSNARLRSTGTVRATVLFVDFSDAPAAITPQDAYATIDPSAAAHFAAQSYGAMTLTLEPSFRWLRMSKPSTEYGWPANVSFNAHRALLQEAADLAGAGTDMTQSDVLVVMTNPDAGAISFGPAFVPGIGGGIRISGRASTIDNATNSGRDLRVWGGLWLTHEMGHLLSLPDLYDYAPTSPGLTHQHTGEFSHMGLISGRGAEWTAFERWQLGWVDDDQMVCTPSGASLVTLSPITQRGGRKAAVVSLSPTSAIVVESRRPEGYDARLPQGGALVYLIDTQVASGRGTMRVLPFADADVSKVTRLLGVGQSVTHQGVGITLLGRSDGSDVVRVMRP